MNVALARLVDLKAALLAEARARGPDGPHVRVPQPARARATSSVDGWVSMVLRLDVLEAAGARSSERRRAWADREEEERGGFEPERRRNTRLYICERRVTLEYFLCEPEAHAYYILLCGLRRPLFQ